MKPLRTIATLCFGTVLTALGVALTAALFAARYDADLDQRLIDLGIPAALLLCALGIADICLGCAILAKLRRRS